MPMPDSPSQRLGSFHLEDLAIVALAASGDQATPALHPDLDDQRRARLRSRIKQIGRHDWPSSLREDPLLRRGYTLRQCLRLITSLLLIDAHLAPSEAIAIAKANELNILRALAPRLVTDQPVQRSVALDDLLIVVPLGELVSLVEDKQWRGARAQAVRLIPRGDLASLWSAEADLAFPGQRLVLDIGLAAAAVWHWMLERNLMTVGARHALLAEIEGERGKRGYVGVTAPVPRRH